MATKFEDLVNNMVNIGFGAAALTAEKGKEVLDSLSAKGEEVRRDSSTPDFARSMSDIFERAGGAFSDVTDRLNTQGETVAERILDELILARVRAMTKAERVEFMAHVRDLIDSVDDDTVSVKVEAVEVEQEATEAEGSSAPETEQDA
ncbi:hypothetical protein [Collinsella ihumii]|uniref:Poly(Hydroxyalkanoate) granule-associated protein n=1 Tax=Collinsella ihumii TaxID=1720204 RepID=A0AAW7JVN9_9ACTN|nr:hypothetical protein [Collinsella ihumii]MDN0069833.1 hypothetical protein [Collinsella ihumii]